MSGTSTITTKGQVTIPIMLRQYLQIKAGDKLYFEIDHKEKLVKLKKSSPKSVVDQLYGSLKSNKPYMDYNLVRQKAGELLAKKYGLKKTKKK